MGGIVNRITNYESIGGCVKRLGGREVLLTRDIVDQFSRPLVFGKALGTGFGK